MDTPAISGQELDPQRQKRAKEYAWLRRRLLLVDLTLGGLYALAYLLSGLSVQLRSTLALLSPEPAIGVALFFVFFALGYGLLRTPLDYYGGFVLPHRYQLSTQSRRGWLSDQIKGAGLSLMLGGTLVEVVYLLLQRSPELWWLWTGLFWLFFSVVLTNLSPLLILPLFYKLTPLADEELARRLQELAERAGTKVRGVFSIDLSRRSVTANAALLGLGNTRRIVLGDTLYRHYSADEIEVVLAHELAHHVHGDIPRGIAVQSALTLAALYLAHLALRWGVSAFGFQSVADMASIPWLALVMGGAMLVSTPLVNAYSRARERAADEYALRTTGRPGAFISAMTKLANQNLADADPEPWVEMLLYSHPPIRKRLELGHRFQQAPAEASGRR
ncbi:MAG: M48 family metallopeptidase [Chloroflexi bacterium]|nr:M48 family metallopeptidase [Chloroflexota bacterium]